MTAGVDGVAVPATGLRKQVGSALRWSSVNSIVQRLTQVGVGVLLARIIAPESFGVFAVALVALNIILSVSELGVSVALVRHEGSIKNLAPTVTTLSIASGSMLAAAMVLIAPWFAASLNAPEAGGVIQLMAVALVVAGFSAVPTAILQRDFRQDHKFAADTTGFVVGTAVAVALALAGFGAWSLAWSRVATNTASAAVTFALTSERYLPGFDLGQARSALRFGLPLAGSSLLVFGVMNVDLVIIGHLLGPVPLAFYVLAFNLASWPVGAFSQPIRSVSLAAFSRVRAEHDVFVRSFRRGIGLLALVTVPACVLLAALSGPLVRFVYGVRWEDAAAPLALLALVGAARVGLELAYDFLASAGRSRGILVIHVVWLVALAPTLMLGATVGGIRGAAAAQAVVVVLVVVPAYLIALRGVGIRVRGLGGPLARPAVGGVLMTAAAIAVQQTVAGDLWQLVIGGPFALAVYAAVTMPLLREIPRLLRRRGDDRVEPAVEAA